MGTGSFPGIRCGRGVTLTPHPLLVPRSKIEDYTSTLLKNLRGLWKGETYLPTKYKVTTLLMFQNICTYLHIFTLLKVITSTVHTLSPTISIAALYSYLLRRCEESVTAELISSSDWNRLLRKFYFTRARVPSNIGQWPSHQLARDGQEQVHFAWRSDVHDFRSIVAEPWNFLPRRRLGTPFSILSFQLRVERMHPWLVNC